MAVSSNYLLSSSAPVRFKSSGALICLVQSILVFSVSQTAGVTHWKLEDNAITPAATDLSAGGAAQDDLFAMSLPSTDPEFAVLLRHATKLPSSTGNRGTLRGGNRGCPVVSISMDGSPANSGRPGCPASGSAKTTVASSDTSASTGKQQCGCRGNSAGAGGGGGGTVDVGCASGESRGVGRGRGESVAPVKKARDPDGDGLLNPGKVIVSYQTPLTCGDPVEFTVYDFLKGIARRHEHKPYPEPEVAMIFKKTDSDTAVDLFEVEMTLHTEYLENPESLTVLNQIGNFWRIKGDTQSSIECFRKALSISPDHPDLLLNLARVLFNLKFYDDAVFLAKRSLHMKSSDHHAWLQYFTLGEVYKALEKYKEAAFYFKKSLELNPGLHVAEMHLRDLGMDQNYSVNAYTLLIICSLICIVLGVIYYLIGAMGT